MLANPSKFLISDDRSDRGPYRRAAAASVEKEALNQKRNFHRFVRLYNSLVALPECDAEITGVDRIVMRDAPRAVAQEIVSC